LNRAITREWIGGVLRKQKQVVFSLMRSFMKIVMLNIFSDGMAQRRLAKEDHAVEAFVFDGADESFGKGVEIRTSRRQRDWFDASTPHDHGEASGEFGVSIANQIPVAGKQLTALGCQIASGLPHPSVSGVAGYPSNVDLSTVNVDEEEAVISDQAEGGPDFGGEEVGGQQTVGVGADEVGPTCSVSTLFRRP
jgi:hypothetical protein